MHDSLGSRAPDTGRLTRSDVCLLPAVATGRDRRYTGLAAPASVGGTGACPEDCQGKCVASRVRGIIAEHVLVFGSCGGRFRSHRAGESSVISPGSDVLVTSSVALWKQSAKTGTFCGKNKDQTCVLCPPNSYSSTLGQMVCSMCRRCEGVFRTRKPCSRTSNTECECAPGLRCLGPGCPRCYPDCAQGQELTEDGPSPWFFPMLLVLTSAMALLLLILCLCQHRVVRWSGKEFVYMFKRPIPTQIHEKPLCYLRPDSKPDVVPARAYSSIRPPPPALCRSLSGYLNILPILVQDYHEVYESQFGESHQNGNNSTRLWIASRGDREQLNDPLSPDRKLVPRPEIESPLREEQREGHRGLPGSHAASLR
ncbi:Tumor necrosis factor receptor superfamily member 9 [Fukomys damarensis]|uniref:Tumor necrosis factor receptor superfamily member 9 n=1 Tax=Fukomys damarensis TaxID=885580 RepID=A0A091E4L7_FUKDA|nr:Tumor necrosis factor receptor superfamily member 9 [Fukomys damarensis]